MLAIINATIITPARTIQRGTALVRFGQIEAVDESAEVTIPSGTSVLDASGLLLAPGFVDLQLNGAFGNDFTQNPYSLWRVAGLLPQYGITAFLPTIITSPLTTVRLAQEILYSGPPKGFNGSRPIGLHVEGPFLNPAKRGAHNPAYLRPPSVEEVANWSPESGVRLVTLAPELLGAMDVIGALTKRGVVVSAGHSMATYDEARTSVMAGISYATHLFNAMPELNHRKPGLIGAVLSDERVTIGLIADGVHVHPSLVKLIWHMTGSDRLNLVTDAMAALGMPPGDYTLGDYKVKVSGEKATLSNGTLAGSILSMDQALRNLLNLTGCSQAEALRTITTTPATLLGIGNRKGQVAPGFDADLVLLTPDFQVVATVIDGQIAYQDNSAGLQLRRLGTGELSMPEG
ncbi:MAG: N-acetylglucosamine-6-phosphate deacetylase [Chloroflexota bacterium]|nr:MAG: N-acetylglucosamine-6-phosphate deacetylase [Chloroflexota bacterium]